jgi:urea ABC transporter urea binding protein
MTGERKDAAAPDSTGGPQKPATDYQRTTDFTPQPPRDPPTVPAPPDAGTALPAAFGRYQVRRALGAGGFGAVYLAHDTQLDRLVAIKVLRAGPGLPQADSERFLQEARRLAKLRHPGIVTVHDVGMHEGQVYIVSDYLDGPDLGRWLRDHRPAWPEAVRIAAAVADALAHAHARLIVHRDVKPANILLTAEGVPVLVDFGLALDEEHAGGREKGMVSGTPWYMSPEQVTGIAHRIDGRTDVYSLGVVLYELLTGRLPFHADDPLELLRQVRDDEPQPPRQLVRDVPPELERACLKAMAKRQQDRYTTAGDFADDLRRVLPPAPQAPDARLSAEVPASGLTTAEPRAVTPSPFRSDVLTPPSTRHAARAAERRQVTLLVCGCSLFESEAYLESLAEDQARVLRAFEQACEEAVRRFDGTVVQCNEQGLLVCFGFPVAYEDGAQRAARTGLALLEDMKHLGEQLRREHKLELNPWVGIHTGPAVVEAKEGAVVLAGEARNVAVRLEDAATPGKVLCTEATHRLIRGQFQCAGLGRRKVKGVPQPVELFRVEGVGEARSPIEVAGPAGLTPLTGRDQEISLLNDRWEKAQEGMGQVVLIVGEPGLGKSRLVYSLKEHVLGQMVEGEVDAPVIEWRCSPHFQNTALYPAIDFYERALGFGREEPPQARFDRLLDRLERYDLARPETVPLWAALLSLPSADRFAPLSLSPSRLREETFRTMLEWLHVRAARKPVLFSIEDLHWADASTLDFLGHFLAEGLHERILMVLTFRPEFQAPWPALAHQTSLALNPLSRRQVGELMHKKTQGTVPEAVVQQVYDRAGGVPLFVEEFTQMVQESGMLGQAEGGAPATSVLPREVPATLHDLVMARLDHMQGGRETAQLAATLGREFTYEMLAAVATVEEPVLQADLARLVQAELLYVKGRPPRCTYVFKHALLEDALYNALVKGKRLQFHRRIAEVLEARFPQTVATQPELLAHHCTEAGLTEKAVGYWLQAGLRSRERSAEIEAIGHLTRGLALLETLPESAERDVRELELLSPLGTAYIASRGYAAPEVGPVFRRARERCERVGQPPQLFALLLGIWEWHTVRSDLGLCMELAAEGMAFAERLNDPGMRMEALFMSAETLLYRGDFAAARDRFATAVTEYDDRSRTKFWAGHTGHNAGVTCRSNLAVCLWHLGYPDQALTVNRQMRQLARDIGHPFSVAYALHHTAWLYLLCRLGTEVQEAAQEEITIAADQGFALWSATGTFFKGAGMLVQGKREEALPLLLRGLDAFRASGAELTLPGQLCTLGDACTQAGRFAEARRALDEGLALAEKHDERFQQAELQRLKGELLLAESPDQAATAEACFRQAIDTARRQQSRAWELRATLSLARLWQRQGRAAEARAALAAIYGGYTEGFTTPDLVDAKALLDNLADGKAPTATTPAVLAGESAAAPPTPKPSLQRSNGSGARGRRNRLAVAGLCLLALLGLAVALWRPWQNAPHPSAGAGVPPRGEPIKVGVLHSLSGTMENSERVVANAVQFALDEVNQAGGVLGRPVQPVVADGRSDWPTFAGQAERLIVEEKVCTVFGCWTSASRKTVKPIFEQHDHLLIYPVQYEGLETSPNIIYMGAAPNQQILPAIEWALTSLHKKRFFLVGSDYVFPRAAHAIIKDQLGRAGVQVVGEAYLPLGSQKVEAVIAALTQAKPDMILNTINGDSNTAFFRALRAAGIKPANIPTLSFSVGEQELRSLTGAEVEGDYAAWTYFQSLDTPENTEFVRRFQEKYPQQSITDPMETAYIAVKLWAAAVNEAQSLDPKKIRRALLNQHLKGPCGEVRIDPDTQHCFRTPRIGQIRADGQFEIVWTAAQPVRPEPYPDSRTAAAWRTFLDDLHTRWGKRWAAPESTPARPTGESRPVIAVLPFTTSGSDPQTEYLRDGIPGALLNKLSETAQLAVRPYSAGGKKPDEEPDLREIGRRLDVQAVLTGRVRQSRDHLFIHVELVNVRDVLLIWAKDYERKPADLQDVETDIAQRVCERLGVVLSRAEHKRVTRRDTADAEAHRLYLQGRYHMLQSSLDGMKNALGCFKQAIVRDPKYALAYSGLADTYGYYAGDWVPYEDALPQQKAAAKKALELDDDLAEAHLAMGNVYMGQDYDWPAADKEFRRAIELKPRLDLAHDAYAQCLAFQGRFADGLAQQQQALEINPHSPYLITNLSYLYYLQRRYDQALEQARKALQIDPEYAAAHDYLGAAYLQKGQFAAALGEFRKCHQIDGVPWYVARLAAAQAVAGNHGEARALLKELQEVPKGKYVTPECYFLVYVSLGDKDQAFTWLQKMYDVRSQYPLRLKVQPDFDSLRTDPRYAEWLRRLKLAP